MYCAVSPPRNVEVEFWPLILMKPAKVEVPAIWLTLRTVPTVVEPVMETSPVMFAPPVSTVNCWPAVKRPVDCMFPDAVMNPVLVMPDDVVVPSRLDEPNTLRLPEESRLADCIPAKVEDD